MKPGLIFILFFIFCFDAFAQNTNGVIILPDPVVTGNKTRNAIAVDKNDKVWIGYKYIGLGKFDNGNWTMYDSINNGLLSNTVYAVAVDANNNIWIGTKNGLQKFNGSTFQSYTTANSGLTDNLITTLFIKGNTIYIGTRSGVNIFDGSNWMNYTTANSNLIADTITAITVTDNNNKYFGTYYGISCLNANGTWLSYNNTTTGIDNSINALMADKNDVYIGTNITSYLLSNNIIKSFESLFPCNDGVSFRTNSFVKTSAGKIYFGYSTSSLIEYSNSNFRKYFLSPSLNNAKYAITSKDSIFIIQAFFTLPLDGFQKFEPALYVDAVDNDTAKYLDINDVKAEIGNDGIMHSSYLNSATANYFVPKCSGKSTVFSSALWVGGLDDNNQLHLAAQTYRQTGTDFFTGPIDTVTHIADSISSAYYNHIWKLDRNQILEFNYQYALGNVSNGTYIIPTDMLTWPAQGILNSAKMLAPFIDKNQDGNYNPYDVDYPDIKGDQYLYWIFNDNLKAHTETGGLPLGVEVHASAYAYDCPQLNDSDAAMNLTTFYQYKIINRSVSNYHNMYIGLFCDMDLGNAIDDYVGCDTTLDIGFAYNGDNDDNGFNGYSGYGLNPPMQDVLILKGPVAANADGKDNNHNGLIDEVSETLGITCFTYYNNVNNTPFGNPAGANHFYHYMKSEWGNGQHFTQGQSGQNPNNIPIDFLYPGLPYDTSQWNCSNFSSTLPHDIRFVMSSGPFNLNSNDTATIDFAYVFTRDESAPNGITTSIARNIKDVQKIIDWYKADNFPSCITATFPPVDSSNTLTLFPNPANQVLQFYLQLHSSSPEFFIYNLLGQQIASGIITGKTISINALSNGIYFLKIKDGDNLFAQRFVKMEMK